MITPTTKCSHDPLRHYLPCAGCAQDEIAALRSRVEVLTTALTKHASQGLAPDGLCWCFYVRICHPEDDPQDSVKTRDGHTEDCWAVRAALSAAEARAREAEIWRDRNYARIELLENALRKISARCGDGVVTLEQIARQADAALSPREEEAKC